MRSYSDCTMIVDGREISKLEIFSEHNVFHVFEQGENVITGSWGETNDFCKQWKEKNMKLSNSLIEAGFIKSVSFSGIWAK